MILFDPTTGLYYYSALFQGDLTLLGILVVMVVFKIQSIESTISDLYRLAAENVHDAFLNKTGVSVPFEIATTEDLRESLDTIAETEEKKTSSVQGQVETSAKAAREIREDHYLQTTLQQIELHENRRMQIIRKMTVPALWISAVIFMSLICMPLTTWLHHMGTAELLAYMITAIIEIIALTYTGLYVIWVLKE